LCFLVRGLLRSQRFPYTTLFRSILFGGLIVRWNYRVVQFNNEWLFAIRPNPIPWWNRIYATILPRMTTQHSSSCHKATLNGPVRSEEHTSELQSRYDLVCSVLLD